MSLTKLSPTNPLAYNPLTLPIPVLGSLFGGGGDKNNVGGKHAAFDAGPLGAYGGGDALPAVGNPLDRAATVNVLPNGPQRNAYSALFDSFQSQFGRAPTAQELAQALPSFTDTGDPNFTDAKGGNSFVSQLAQQLQNSPQAIYQREQAKYLADAPKYADQVSQNFKSLLGRDPTKDELTHFGAAIAAGQDPYQIGQALQQTQEYQNKQNTDFQNKLQGQLQGSNSDYFNKYILPSIQSQNAQAGRTQDSSGYQAQLANAAQGQNYQLQNFLAGVTAQNYQNSTANATNQYNQLLGQQYGLQNANVSNQLSNQYNNQQYNQNLNMYQLQQQAYNNYLNSYGKRNGLAAGLGGALSGGVSGALAGSKFGPQGALFGGLGGAALGGASGAYL